jgi:prevent-host-death family protein
VFVHRDGNRKGAVAEAKIAAAAIELGVPVLKPMSEHGRYDLVFEVANRLLRVQCKWANHRGDVVAVHIGGSYLSARGYVRSTYRKDEIDLVGVYCGELDKCYLLPVSLIEGQHMIHLRVVPPKNGQRAALHWLADHDLRGAIAQLEERYLGMVEVAGSSPAGSTPPLDANRDVVVGAHEFRNRFGWYMERAAAGESFLVTRRGKPSMRLIPPTSSP